MSKLITRRVPVCFGLALLSACATVGPEYTPPAVLSGHGAKQADFVEAHGPAYSSEPLPDRWWHLYADPRLDGFVEEAIAANTDLRVAAATLEKSWAIVGEVRARAGLQTSLDGGVSAGESSNLGKGRPDGTHATFDTGVGIAYELDVAGRIRRMVEAAQADADAQAAAYDLARTSIVASVVSTYGDVCAAGARMKVARRSVNLQKDSLALTERGVKAGVYSPLDAMRSRSLLAQLEAALPPIDAGRRAALYRFAVLQGKAPEAYPPALAECETIPTISQPLPIGDGMAMIRRRPDIRQAERKLAAATARIGVATTQLYPSVSFSASLGTTARSVSGLADSSAFRFGIGPLVSWSFPNRAVARTQIAQADADARAALATFDGSVLSALREAETALSKYVRDLDENAKLRLARDENQRAAALQARMTRGGLGTGLERIDAERTLAASEVALALSDAAIAGDRARLFLALGGGWDGS